MTTIYEAEDGTRFLSEDACREYEEMAKQPFQKVLNAARILKEFCGECNECPFFVAKEGTCIFKNDFPCQWDI